MRRRCPLHPVIQNVDPEETAAMEGQGPAALYHFMWLPENIKPSSLTTVGEWQQLTGNFNRYIEQIN